MDLIFSTTLVLLALTATVVIALIFSIFVAFQFVIKEYESREQVRPLLGVVMPNQEKKEDN
jgi:hypothetical protein